MRRLHLIELEDLPWFPAPVRDAGTDFLRFMLNVGNNYAPAVPLLAGALKCSGAGRIVDLCSGGGGPWQRLLPALAGAGVACEVLLTDRFPNQAAAAALRAVRPTPGAVAYHAAPVDALAVPGELDGFRTLFSAFHHFPPEAAAGLLRDAVRSGAPIAVFEATQRTGVSLAGILLAPLVLLLATPFIRPFRWSRLLLTYLIPAVPLMVLWDGIVSCLRSYTAAELRAMVAAVPEADAYEWAIGELRGPAPIPVTYLIGLPRAGYGSETTC
ncbi:MAG TPA: class I SAM-dependent methyltransferase [Chloroflexaceae bacterium]|nr:class I SAM-dependent methyltransferase [Chloroflexaceae bacterium]